MSTFVPGEARLASKWTLNFLGAFATGPSHAGMCWVPGSELSPVAGTWSRHMSPWPGIQMHELHTFHQPYFTWQRLIGEGLGLKMFEFGSVLTDRSLDSESKGRVLRNS